MSETLEKQDTINEILSYLRNLIAPSLDMDQSDIDFEQPLLELGADSIVMTSVLAGIKQNYGVSIRMLQLFEEVPDILSLAQYIDKVIRTR